MLITKDEPAANIHKLRFEMQKCALNARGKHNRAIVCASCDGSNTLRYPQPLFLHWTGPNNFVRHLSGGSPRRTPTVRGVREMDTFLELVAIKKVFRASSPF